MSEHLPARVKRYICWSLAPTAALAVLAFIVDPHPSVALAGLAYPLMIAIGWLGEEYRVLTRHGAYHTLTAAVHLPLILLFSPLEGMLLAALSCTISLIRRQRSVYRVAYNAVVRSISVGTPSLLLWEWRHFDPIARANTSFLTLNALHVSTGTVTVSDISSLAPNLLLSGELIAGCVLAALLYFGLDSMLVSMAVAIRMDISPLAVWKSNMASTILPEITKSVLGIIAACIAVVNPVFVVFLIFPVAVTHVTTKAILRLERETIEAVTAMADTIDYRDQYTAQHSVRVADVSRRLARRLGLPQDQVDEITLAARVHDLGKIGIPNSILLKEGRLTAEEMSEMQKHPVLGEEILLKYHNFHVTLPIVRHHHERYDGKGYPDGLAGDAIPLGARIVAHADSYDAMTSDRPYRKGMRPEIAVQRIGEASGTQFDPAVAGAFVAMMREELAAAGQHLPDTGGSLAEPYVTPVSLAAGAENNVIPLRPKQ